MLSLSGKILLSLALLFALAQSFLPLIGYYRHNAYLLALARPAASLQWGCVLFAYTLLTFAFVQNDFSLVYVAENSHPGLPLMYRITAVWGAHEGSILFWILVLNCWSFIYSIFSSKYDVENRAVVLAILGLLNAAFLIFLLATSNPFLQAHGLQTPKDLNPLLQDPGLVIHPPMLYIGYVGFSVAFALTQAALLQGKLNAAWAKSTRHYALAAWCFLTFGITLGSWWAYRVLGWGGFWFWDPVENASLLPWLSGTALIHVLILAEKKNHGVSWAIILGSITFALSLLGTFLVRSGLLVSAHTFAADPSRGIVLLILLSILLCAALLVYLTCMPKMTTSSTSFTFLSREMSLFVNSALLFVAMLTILLGTLYPLILDALQLGAVSVGAPYFNTVMLPLVFILMFCMGAAALLNWQHTKKNIYQIFIKHFLLSLSFAILLLWFFSAQFNLTAMISLTLSFWIILNLYEAQQFFSAMTIAHFGFAILIIGIMLSSLLNVEHNVRMKENEVANVGPYQFLFLSTHGIAGTNYRGLRADFEVSKKHRVITHLYPEKRIYTVREMVMTKVGIHAGIFRDLYIALGEPLDHDYWSVRLYYKPFIRFIWAGGVLMMIGGFFALFPRKLNKSKI